MVYNNFFKLCLFSYFLSWTTTMANTPYKIRDFETVRLKSTAGAGVGSMLLNESAVLNPATVAFFNFSTFYIQREQSEMANTGDREWAENQFNDESGNTALIIADATNPNMKGTMAYTTQQEGTEKRKRVSAAFGKPIGKKSSIGMLYRYTIENSLLDGEDADSQKFHQLSMGAFHAIEDNLTIGIVANDIAKQRTGESKVIAGGQYFYRDIIALIFDFGIDPYAETMSDNFLYKGAVQLNFFSDLYLRGGVFTDKIDRVRGNGIGLGWVGPKLVIDFAFKNSKPMSDDSPLLRSGETLKDTGLSLTYKF